jgi:hypothetical protein
MQAKAAALQEQIQEVVVKSEVLAEQGDIDGAQAATLEAEALKVRLSRSRKTRVGRTISLTSEI